MYVLLTRHTQVIIGSIVQCLCTRPNGAAVRECIEYGIAQSRSQYYMSRLGWPAHVHVHVQKK